MNSASQQGGAWSTNNQTIINFNGAHSQIASPSIFMTMISYLTQSGGNDRKVQSDDLEPYDIDLKLETNDVCKYRERIEEYYAYVGMIENAYNTLYEKTPSAKENALEKINGWYKDCLGEIYKKNKIEYKKCKDKESREIFKRQMASEYSDEIIECVIEHVKTVCVSCVNSDNIPIEVIYLHSEYIVFHAFVECKVLEKPLC